MLQFLRAHNALAEDLRPVPSTQAVGLRAQVTPTQRTSDTSGLQTEELRLTDLSILNCIRMVSSKIPYRISDSFISEEHTSH